MTTANQLMMVNLNNTSVPNSVGRRESRESSFAKSTFSRTSEIETEDMSQSHAGLNLSQFQTDCLLRINSSTAILNYFKLF